MILKKTNINKMSERRCPSWKCPDIPGTEIKRITAERAFGNNDIHDLLTRMFACVYFNTEFPKNSTIKIKENASDGWLCFDRNDDGCFWTDDAFWSNKDPDHVVKTISSILSHAAHLRIPKDFSMDQLKQQFMNVIVTGPTSFGYNQDLHFDRVTAIQKRYGDGPSIYRDFVFITAKDTLIVVDTALDWVYAYKRLISYNLPCQHYVLNLYLYQPERLSITSRNTLLRTLENIKSEPYISLYFLDEMSNEQCVFDAKESHNLNI